MLIEGFLIVRSLEPRVVTLTVESEIGIHLADYRVVFRADVEG